MRVRATSAPSRVTVRPAVSMRSGPERDHGRAVGAGGGLVAAQGRPDAGDELGHLERLAHVVVGARLEARRRRRSCRRGPSASRPGSWPRGGSRAGPPARRASAASRRAGRGPAARPRQRSRPSAPSAAVVTPNPAALSPRAVTSRIDGSSSTSRIRASTPGSMAARAQAPRRSSASSWRRASLIPKWCAISWRTVSWTRSRTPSTRAGGPEARAAIDRDPRGHEDVVGVERRPRHALVQPVQARHAHALEQLPRRPVLDRDRDGAEPLAERGGQPVDGLQDPVLERLVVDRLVHHERSVPASRAACGRAARPRLR